MSAAPGAQPVPQPAPPGGAPAGPGSPQGTPGARTPRPWPRLPITAVVVLANLVVLVLPLIGIAALRIYETELVRQTEAELQAQGTFIVAAFRQAIRAQNPAANHGRPVAYQDPVWEEAAGLLRARELRRQQRREQGLPPLREAPVWTPRPPSLDLNRHRPLPQPPPTLPAATAPDALAARAGEMITPVLLEAQRSTLAGIRITDHAGRVVATTGSQQGHDLYPWPEVQRALRGETVALLRQRETDTTDPPLDAFSRATLLRVFVALPVRDGDRIWGVVLLSRTPKDLRRALWEQRRPLYLGGMVILGVLAVLAVLTSLAISLPLRTLAAQARRAAEGQRQAIRPLALPITQEVGQVSDSMVRLTSALQERERYIRAFARQISHELKTPIANVQGAVELLIDHGDGMETAARERFLMNIQHNADKMDRLVQRLLTLARAETMVPAGEHATPLRPLLQAIISDATWSGLGRPPVLMGTVPVVALTMAAETFETILSSLIENAYQHGGPEVLVTVTVEPAPLSASRERATVAVLVADDGKGIDPDVAETLFDPFVTTGAARGATGLGLPIVRSLAQAHGGMVTLASAGLGAGPGAGRRGAVFRVVLPVRPMVVGAAAGAGARTPAAGEGARAVGAGER